MNGVRCVVGYGCPGTPHTKERNNCLIDSLRQCLGIRCDRTLVRQDLLEQFGAAVGSARVTPTNFLDVKEHGRAIVASLLRHQEGTVPAPQDYCIIALHVSRDGSADHGFVVGNLRAAQTFIVLSKANMHFDPCLPQRADNL